MPPLRLEGLNELKRVNRDLNSEVESLKETIDSLKADARGVNLGEHEAMQRDASPRIKEAYRQKAEERDRQMAIREAEELLRDACDSRDEDAVDHALRQAKHVGGPSDADEVAG